MITGFFKLYKPRTYSYRYIYYDPKKEARKEREEKYMEKDEKGEFQTSIKRGSFREQRSQQNRMYRDNIRQANIRLVIIIAVLFLIVYFILKTI